MLENWLPLLTEFRMSRPDGSIIAFVPDRRTLAQIDPVDTAHRLFDEVVDLTIAPLWDHSWIATERFLDAPRAAAPRPILKRLPTRAQRRAHVDLTKVRNSNATLLYDLYLEGKPQLSDLLGLFHGMPRIAQFHGGELRTELSHPVEVRDREQLRAALLFGPDEIPAYTHNFGLAEDVLRVTGLLRQSPDWIEHVVRRSSELHTLPFERFAFVVSRPADSTYLPRERKIDALRSIHDVLWGEHGIPLVLRTHPKESDDGTLHAAFPRDHEGVSWSRSRAHPFHLARSSELAITFLSGLSIDLVGMGVPTIEFLDVRGLPEHDNTESTRDSRGRPVFGPYRRDGIVIPADDVDDLRLAVQSLAANRGSSIEALQVNLRRLFPAPAGLSDLAHEVFDKP